MANLSPFDPLSDSFEEAFRRIFGPARSEVQGVTTDIELDVQEDEQARELKAKIAPCELPAIPPAGVPDEAGEGQAPARRTPQERAIGPTYSLPDANGRRGPSEIDQGD
jgi:hypothetical protein